MYIGCAQFIAIPVVFKSAPSTTVKFNGTPSKSIAIEATGSLCAARAATWKEIKSVTSL